MRCLDHIKAGSFCRKQVIIILACLFLQSAITQELLGQNEEQDTLVESHLKEEGLVDLLLDQPQHSREIGARTKVKMLDSYGMSLDQKLAGTVPGIIAVQNTGQPGATVGLQIRGIHSLSAGMQPLFVIDGLPLYNNNQLVNGGFVAGPPLNGLTFLDPSDIESIDVLRGIGATGIYGNRGSNGVILVTTKKGQPGATGFEVQADVGISSAIQDYELASANQYAAFVNEAHLNAGEPVPYDASLASNGTDWSDAIFRKTPLQQHYRLSFRGGTENFRYRLSSNYRDQYGLLHGSEFQRLNIHAHVQARVRPTVDLVNVLNFSRLDAHTVATDRPGFRSDFGVVSSAYLFNPLIPLRNVSGNLIPFNFLLNQSGEATTLLANDAAIANPLGLATAATNELATSRMTDQFAVQYRLGDNVTIQARLGLDAIFNDEATFFPGSLQFDKDLGGLGSASKMNSYQWMQQYAVGFEKKLFKNLNFTVLGGYQAEGFRREFLAGNSAGFENEALSFYSLGVGKNKSVFSDVIRWGLQSYFARASFNASDQYVVNLTARSDQSSRFGEDFDFFPSLSVVWQASQSPLLINHKVISKASLRMGYGITGNQEIAPLSRFTFLTELTSARDGAVINGIGPGRIGNRNLQVERTKQFDVGLSIGLWENTLQLELDYYHHITDNAILNMVLPAPAGHPSQLVNGAELVNSGLELSIRSLLKRGDFSWSSELNLGSLHNEISALPNQVESLSTGPMVADVEQWSLLQVGQSVGTFFWISNEWFL